MNLEQPYKVKIINPVIRERNGKFAHYSLDIALRGVSKGLWEIIDERFLAAAIPQAVSPPTITAPEIEIVGVVSILILVMNNLYFTIKCIESIKKHTKPETYQLIVVDNGSNDGTLDWLNKNLRPSDLIIRNLENKGFSTGNNQALRNADGEFILMLNNDTEIQKDDWLKPFFESMRDKDIVGPTFRRVIPDTSSFQFIFAGDGSCLDPWSYLEGWCLFGRKTTFTALGGFDERFFPAYSEDTDLSFTAKYAGYRLGIIKNVSIVHFGSKTSGQLNGRVQAISETNRTKLYRKWLSKAPLSILIKRRGAIGDVLMITPIIRALRAKHPRAEIIIETQCPQMLEGNPCITNIVTSANHAYFDHTFKLEYERNPGEVRIDSMARQAGVTLESCNMEVFFPEIKVDLPKPYIVFHTGRTWPNREWSIDNFQTMAAYFISKGFSIVQLGNEKTLPIQKSIDCRNKSWAEVASILKEAKAFFGIDSACSNLAKAVRTPAYIIYGCVNHNVMLADAEEYPLYVPNLECFGCRDKSTANYVECTKPEPYCLTRLTPKMVINKLEETLTQ